MDSIKPNSLCLHTMITCHLTDNTCQQSLNLCNINMDREGLLDMKPPIQPLRTRIHVHMYKENDNAP